VVTAQKREQNLQDVPISITALTGEAITANRIADVRDLSAVAPNLTVRVASGGSQIANFSMRGLVTGGSAPGSDKGISLYVDGVYVQSVIGSVFELADIERIEVLKGPQGTLFGRNATAGAISIITRNPTGQFGVRQELTYGNYDQLRSKTRVDLPQWGPVSASLTYTHAERRGDIRNLGAGTRWDYTAATAGGWGVRTSPKWLGDQNTESFAAAVKVDVSPDFEVDYKYDYTQKHYTADGQGLAGLNFAALGPLGASINTLVATQPNPANLTQVSRSRPKAVNNWFTTPGFLENWGHSLTARYQVNDQIALKNILAYRRSHVENSSELDGLGGLINTVPALGALGAPYLVVVSGSRTDEEQWSNEFQVNVDTKLVQLTAGYLYFHDRILTGAVPGVATSISFSTRPGFVIPFNGSQRSDIRATSEAVYLQPEIHVTERLDLVLGGRLTWDRKNGVDRTSPALGSIPFTYKNHKYTWLAGVNYRPTDDLLTYAKFATGYISGGFLATRTFAPETSKSWEAGVKADLLDRRLRSNLAVFTVKYNALQLTTSGLNVGIPLAAQVVINGGDARARGVEWENTAVPVRGLTLTANVGYTDFKYRSVNPVLRIGGQFLPTSRPMWTGSGSVQYETEELFRGGHLTVRGDVNVKGKTNLVSAMLTPLAVQNGVTKSTWIFNGRVALSDIALAGGRAELALWGRNLTNVKQFNNVSTFAFALPGAYERARTVGVDLTFSY
jgi:iron complex outermembrane receptor protein